MPETGLGLEIAITPAFNRADFVKAGEVQGAAINEGLSKATRRNAQPLGRITGQTSEFEKSMAAANARVLAFGASAGSIYLVKSAFEKLLSSTINVEKGLANINVILGLGQTQLRGFSEQMFKAASAAGQTFESASKVALEFARHGVSAQETLKRMTSALQLMRISGLDAEESVAVMTASINSFNKEGITAADVVNRLTAVDTKFAVSAQDLAKAIERVGSTAADAGIGFNQLLGFVTAAQTATSRGGAVIGNAFKSIFTRLARPEVLSDLASIGVVTKTSAGQMLPMKDILQDLSRKYNTLGQEQKSFISEAVGGVYQVNILKASMADLGNGISLVDKAAFTAGTSIGLIDKRMAELNETLSSKLIVSANSIEQVFSSFGNIAISDKMKDGLNAVNDFLSKVNGSMSGFKPEDTSWQQSGKIIGGGIAKGIGSILSGPGIQVAVLLITKSLVALGKFAVDAARDFTGMTKSQKEQEALHSSIEQHLNNQRGLTEKILSGELSIKDAAMGFVNALQHENELLAAQKRIITELSNFARPRVDVSSISGVTSKGVGKAGGFVPNFADPEIQQANKIGYYPNRSFTYNNPILGPTRVNNGELTNREPVANPQGGFYSPGTFIINPFQKDTVKGMALTPLEKFKADGFLPNFAPRIFGGIPSEGILPWLNQGSGTNQGFQTKGFPGADFFMAMESGILPISYKFGKSGLVNNPNTAGGMNENKSWSAYREEMNRTSNPSSRSLIYSLIQHQAKITGKDIPNIGNLPLLEPMLISNMNPAFVSGSEGSNYRNLLSRSLVTPKQSGKIPQIASAIHMPFFSAEGKEIGGSGRDYMTIGGQNKPKWTHYEDYISKLFNRFLSRGEMESQQLSQYLSGEKGQPMFGQLMKWSAANKAGGFIPNFGKNINALDLSAKAVTVQWMRKTEGQGSKGAGDIDTRRLENGQWPLSFFTTKDGRTMLKGTGHDGKPRSMDVNSIIDYKEHYASGFIPNFADSRSREEKLKELAERGATEGERTAAALALKRVTSLSSKDMGYLMSQKDIIKGGMGSGFAQDFNIDALEMGDLKYATKQGLSMDVAASLAKIIRKNGGRDALRSLLRGGSFADGFIPNFAFDRAANFEAIAKSIGVDTSLMGGKIKRPFNSSDNLEAIAKSLGVNLGGHSGIKLPPSVSEALKTEASYGKGAVLDYDSRIGPFVRQPNQPSNLDALIRKDHPEGLEAATAISRINQGKATGFVPNFAVAGLPDFSMSLLLGGLQGSGVKTDMASLSFGFKKLVHDLNEAGVEFQRVTKNLQAGGEELYRGEKYTKENMEGFKEAFTEANKKTRFSPSKIEENAIKFDAYSKEIKDLSSSIHGVGFKSSIAAPLVGGIASQSLASMGYTDAAKATNTMTSGLTMAGQALMALPNKLGGLIAGAAVFSAASKAVVDFRNGVGATQRNLDEVSSRLENLSAALNMANQSYENLQQVYASGSASMEQLIALQRNLAKGMAELAAIPGGSKFVTELSSAGTAQGRANVQARATDEMQNEKNRLQYALELKQNKSSQEKMFGLVNRSGEAAGSLTPSSPEEQIQFKSMMATGAGNIQNEIISALTSSSKSEDKELSKRIASGTMLTTDVPLMMGKARSTDAYKNIESIDPNAAGAILDILKYQLKQASIEPSVLESYKKGLQELSQIHINEINLRKQYNQTLAEFLNKGTINAQISNQNQGFALQSQGTALGEKFFKTEQTRKVESLITSDAEMIRRRGNDRAGQITEETKLKVQELKTSASSSLMDSIGKIVEGSFSANAGARGVGAEGKTGTISILPQTKAMAEYLQTRQGMYSGKEGSEKLFDLQTKASPEEFAQKFLGVTRNERTGALSAEGFKGSNLELQNLFTEVKTLAGSPDAMKKSNELLNMIHQTNEKGNSDANKNAMETEAAIAESNFKQASQILGGMAVLDRNKAREERRRLARDEYMLAHGRNDVVRGRAAADILSMVPENMRNTKDPRIAALYNQAYAGVENRQNYILGRSNYGDLIRGGQSSGEAAKTVVQGNLRGVFQPGEESSIVAAARVAFAKVGGSIDISPLKGAVTESAKALKEFSDNLKNFGSQGELDKINLSLSGLASAANEVKARLDADAKNGKSNAAAPATETKNRTIIETMSDSVGPFVASAILNAIAMKAFGAFGSRGGVAGEAKEASKFFPTFEKLFEKISRPIEKALTTKIGKNVIDEGAGAGKTAASNVAKTAETKTLEEIAARSEAAAAGEEVVTSAAKAGKNIPKGQSTPFTEIEKLTEAGKSGAELPMKFTAGQSPSEAANIPGNPAPKSPSQEGAITAESKVAEQVAKVKSAKNVAEKIKNIKPYANAWEPTGGARGGFFSSAIDSFRRGARGENFLGRGMAGQSAGGVQRAAFRTGSLIGNISGEIGDTGRALTRGFSGGNFIGRETAGQSAGLIQRLAFRTGSSTANILGEVGDAGRALSRGISGGNFIGRETAGQSAGAFQRAAYATGNAARDLGHTMNPLAGWSQASKFGKLLRIGGIVSAGLSAKEAYGQVKEGNYAGAAVNLGSTALSFAGPIGFAGSIGVNYAQSKTKEYMAARETIGNEENRGKSLDNRLMFVKKYGSRYQEAIKKGNSASEEDKTFISNYERATGHVSSKKQSIVDGQEKMQAEKEAAQVGSFFSDKKKLIRDNLMLPEGMESKGGYLYGYKGGIGNRHMSYLGDMSHQVKDTPENRAKYTKEREEQRSKIFGNLAKSEAGMSTLKAYDDAAGRYAGRATQDKFGDKTPQNIKDAATKEMGTKDQEVAKNQEAFKQFGAGVAEFVSAAKAVGAAFEILKGGVTSNVTLTANLGALASIIDARIDAKAGNPKPTPIEPLPSGF